PASTRPRRRARTSTTRPRTRPGSLRSRSLSTSKNGSENSPSPFSVPKSAVRPVGGVIDCLGHVLGVDRNVGRVLAEPLDETARGTDVHLERACPPMNARCADGVALEDPVRADLGQ